MLKVIYTETGQHLEYVSSAFHQWIAYQRCLVSQMGGTLHVEGCTASILLPATQEVINTLKTIHSNAVQGEHGSVTWSQADADSLEVMLVGVWISSHVAAIHAVTCEGAFLTDLGDRTALVLLQLWEQAIQPTVGASTWNDY